MDHTGNVTSDSSETVTEIPKARKPRGFAAMDRSKVSAIASKGGKAAHAAGTAHQFNREEAQIAGRKGGIAPHVRRGRGKQITSDNRVTMIPPGDSIPESKVA